MEYYSVTRHGAIRNEENVRPAFRTNAEIDFSTRSTSIVFLSPNLVLGSRLEIFPIKKLVEHSSCLPSVTLW